MLKIAEIIKLFFSIRVIKQHNHCIKWMTVWTICKYKNIQAYNPSFSALYRLLIPHMLPALVLKVN